MADRRCKPRRSMRDGLKPSDPMMIFFLAALAYIAAAVVLLIISQLSGDLQLRWLALHLAFVGGISQLVVGASQFFAGAFLATGPPPRSLVRAQLLAWNLGTILIAAGREAGISALTVAGGLSVIAGLVFYILGLRALKGGSLQSFPWATRWYYACAAFLLAGSALGIALAVGLSWSAGDLLSAHITLNVAGWFGTAIAGTLHTFYPSLSATTLRLPRLQGPTFTFWALGCTTLAAGLAYDSELAQIAGLALLALAAVLLLINIVATTASASAPLTLPARLVGYAQAFLLLGVATVIIGVADQGEVLAGSFRGAAAVLLIEGWVGMTVAGSLIHLLAVLARVRNLAREEASLSRPLPRVLAPLATLSIITTATGTLTGPTELTYAAQAVAILCYLALLIKIIHQALTASRAAPLRI